MNHKTRADDIPSKATQRAATAPATSLDSITQFSSDSSMVLRNSYRSVICSIVKRELMNPFLSVATQRTVTATNYLLSFVKYFLDPYSMAKFF